MICDMVASVVGLIWYSRRAKFRDACDGRDGSIEIDQVTCGMQNVSHKVYNTEPRSGRKLKSRNGLNDQYLLKCYFCTGMWNKQAEPVRFPAAWIE